MKIWKNTPTLDNYLDPSLLTDSPREAGIVLLGAKSFEIDKFPSLKGIYRAGISKDNIPMAEAQKRNIKVAFPSQQTVETIYEETASFACHLIFRMMYSEVGTLDPWQKKDRPSLQNRELLVVGKGNIGRRVSQRMRAFMQVKTYDIIENTPDELLSGITSVDCISLHIPLTKETEDFFNKEKLGLMRKNAALINTSRGAIVNEDDLFREISSGRLRAAFDVFWKEPYAGKLKEFHPDRFFMTPHIASTCDAFLKGAAEDLLNFMKVLEHD